jgi:hypothetical protein
MGCWNEFTQAGEEGLICDNKTLQYTVQFRSGEIRNPPFHALLASLATLELKFLLLSHTIPT